MSDQAKGSGPRATGYLAALAVAIVVATALTWWTTARERHEVLDQWAGRLDGIAEAQARMVSAWLNERRADAAVVARYPSLVGLLAGHPDAADPAPLSHAEILRHLPLLLDHVAESHSDVGLYVLDRSGRIVLHSSQAAVLDESVIRAIGESVVTSGRARLGATVALAGAWTVAVAVPVVMGDAAAPTIVGAVATVVDPTHKLAALLNVDGAVTRTGETFLVEAGSDRIALVVPPRATAPGPQQLDGVLRPLPSPDAQTRGRVREFIDPRGRRVLAVQRPIPMSGWRLVHKIDRDEVLEGVDIATSMRVMIAALMVVAFGGLLLGQWRRERIRALEQQVQYQDALRRFHDLAQGVDAVLWEADVITDPSAGGTRRYHLRSISRRAAATLGACSEESLQQPDFWTQRIHPDDRERAVGLYRQVLADGMSRTLEYRLLRDGRSAVWLRDHVTVVCDPGGDVSLVRGVLVDVTANKEAAEQIRQLNAELEQRVARRTAQLEAANQELEAFGYSVSHDLRAPLRSIQGFSQALREDCAEQLDEQGRHYLQRVEAATERMGRLIDGLLNLSRIVRVEMQPQTVDLSALAAGVAADLRKLHPERNVACVIAPGLRANGDPTLLRALLENLLGNAWKYSGKRDTARVEFGMTTNGDGATYFVRDNGAGFDMAQATKLFGAFQRLHPADEFEGTGIGLATARRIVMRHGGRIWAEAQVDQGATFFFTLPA